MHPLPTEIPTAEITGLVIAALRRDPVDYKKAAHATWQVAGFGLSQWIQSPAMTTAAKPTLTDEEAATLLESLHLPVARGGASQTIPWSLLLPLLIRLLERLVGG